MSTIEEVLDIDLNDVVSKAINKRITQLEKQISDQEQKLHKQSQEIQDLNAKAKMADLANGLIEKLRAQYAAIKDVKDHKGNVSRSEWRGKYQFIRDVSDLIYGIVLEEELISYDYVTCSLAYAARNHKDMFCEILSMVDQSAWCADKINEIRKFRMPVDFSLSEVKSMIRTIPHSDSISAWIQDRFKESYTPLSLLMRSPHFVKDECFRLVVQAIMEKRQYSERFFALPFCNDGITDEQIQVLGSLAVDIPIKGHQTETSHGKFIAHYLRKFRKPDIDKLFEKINLTTTDWSALYWGIFPIEYQMKAFRKMTFKALTELLGNHSSRFTVENREAIFADWFIHNPHPHTPRPTSV